MEEKLDFKELLELLCEKEEEVGKGVRKIPLPPAGRVTYPKVFCNPVVKEEPARATPQE